MNSSSNMTDRLRERLEDLRRELSDGEGVIAELQARQSQVRETLLRISGAVQVLEEVLQEEEAEAPPSPVPLQQPPQVEAPLSPAPRPIVPSAAAAPTPAPAPAAWP